MAKQVKPPGSNRRLVTSTAPAPVAPVVAVLTSGRYCSRCRTVRPASMFAPSSAGFGILNWICRICDGTYVRPVPSADQQMLIDRLRLDLDEANERATKYRLELLAATNKLKAPGSAPLVIPADASTRVEKKRLAGDEYEYTLLVETSPRSLDYVAVHTGVASSRSKADGEALRWIAEHREPDKHVEAQKVRWEKERGKSAAETPELETTN